MIMCRGMGVTHVIAGIVLLVCKSAAIDATVSDQIILSQIVGGVIMAIIGFKFKL